MTPERQFQLTSSLGWLSIEEMKEGWHFCKEQNNQLSNSPCSCPLSDMLAAHIEFHKQLTADISAYQVLKEQDEVFGTALEDLQLERFKRRRRS